MQLLNKLGLLSLPASGSGGIVGCICAIFQMDGTESNRVSDRSVLSQDSAQVAIAVADAALKDLGNVRSALGSVQNRIDPGTIILTYPSTIYRSYGAGGAGRI